MAIKHVLLDLDDTLFDFKRSERYSISLTLSGFGITPTDETVSLYSSINKSCWEALERKEMTRGEVLVKRFERLLSALGKSGDPKKIKELYENTLSECHFLVPGAEELIDSLRGRYTLSIASNGTARVQDKRIAKSGLAPLFDHIFISEKLGADKPSKIFFDKCFEALGNPDPCQVVIVGDSMSSDIKGGVIYGMHTIRFTPGGKEIYGDIRPEYEAVSLKEIPDIIEKIN